MHFKCSLEKICKFLKLCLITHALIKKNTIEFYIFLDLYMPESIFPKSIWNKINEMEELKMEMKNDATFGFFGLSMIDCYTYRKRLLVIIIIIRKKETIFIKVFNG